MSKKTLLTLCPFKSECSLYLISSAASASYSGCVRYSECGIYKDLSSLGDIENVMPPTKKM